MFGSRVWSAVCKEEFKRSGLKQRGGHWTVDTPNPSRQHIVWSMVTRTIIITWILLMITPSLIRISMITRRLTIASWTNSSVRNYSLPLLLQSTIATTTTAATTATATSTPTATATATTTTTTTTADDSHKTHHYQSSNAPTQSWAWLPSLSNVFRIPPRSRDVDPRSLKLNMLRRKGPEYLE